MRDYRFRAKRIDCSNEWVYGGGVWPFGDKTALFGPDAHDSPQVTIVDHKTVGQFTGLLDKNGKEEFEDDLALWPRTGTTFQIIWECSGWQLKKISGPYSYPIFHLIFSDSTE